MSFLPHTAYKDSGAEWIGQVPMDWNFVALKRDLAFLTSGSRGWADYYADEGAFFIRIGNLTRDSLHIDLSDIQRVAVPEGSEGERTRVQSGDILFSITAFMGSVAVVPEGLETAYVSQHVALARLKGELLTPRWVGYSVLSSAGKAYLEAQCYGGTKIQLGLDDVANLPVAMPSLDQQRALVAFLDRETGKIDALVAEQERLMALLKEKRQAVISHAVTKGLDPNAPMKDSGVEWLGEVPKAWTVKRIKCVTQSFEQGWSPQCDGYPVASPDEWGVLKVGCVNGGVFNENENKSLPGELAPRPDLAISANDILISRANTRELVGSAACVLYDHPRLLLCDKLYRLRVARGTCHPQLLALYLASTAARGQIELAATGASASMVNISQDAILELPISLPPAAIQSSVISFVQHETAKLAVLAAEAERAIALLKERRAALISAAVTGKIDVRGLVPDARQAA